MAGHFATRTKRLGPDVLLPALGDLEGKDEAKRKVAEIIVNALAAVDSGRDKAPALSDQLVFLTSREIENAKSIAMSILRDELDLPQKKEKKARAIAERVLERVPATVDIGLFGRMLTGTDNVSQEFSRDAACQVAHAITTHKAFVENDYFTALDDLAHNQASAHIDEAGFGSGVFYVYACVDRALLLENLGGDRELAGRAIEAFVEAFALASPSGKKNSFANRVRAEFLLAERGDRQPRTLASAFLRAVNAERAGGDLMRASIQALARKRAAFERAYGRDWAEEQHMNACEERMSEADPFAVGAVALGQLAAFAAADMEGVPMPAEQVPA